MIKLTVVLIIALFSLQLVFSQETENAVKIKWLKFEEAMELNKTAPKKILIDFTTSWCGWCKVMDKNTFSNPNIAAYISQNFYAVRFDAETKDTITYKEKKYVNKGTGNRPPHELAVELLKGQLSYPTILYMDENSNPISAVPGYMKPEEIEPVLVFFSQDVYKQIPFEKFKEFFNTTYKDSALTTPLVKWYSMEEAVELNKKKPKKILLDLYVDWCVTCNIMNRTSYNNPLIAEYINKNYYPVRFNALSKDTVNFLGNIFTNPPDQGHPYHQFAVSLLQGKMNFPMVIYIGSDNKLISNVPGYFSPEILEPVLHFFSEDIFKTKTFEDYRKEFKGTVKN
jgi:thioredoxin-related protein